MSQQTTTRKRSGDSRSPKGDKKAEKKPKQTPGQWTREQVEAIVVAIILALMIRHFVVEAFKIPTGSMQPTLYGSERGGDRILVFKPAFLASEPSRWDIVVFRYPLNTSVNYIKRLIGLPGEEIRIQDGDIFVDGEIATKPRRKQQHLWRNWPVYPRPGSEEPVEQLFRHEPAGVFARDGEFLRAESAEEAALRYPTAITVGGTAGRYAGRGISRAPYAKAIVRDVKVAFDARLETPDTVIFAEIRESEHVFRLEVPAGGHPRILHLLVDEEREAPGPDAWEEIGRAEDVVVPPETTRSVAFYFLDGGIHADVSGEPVLSVPYPLMGSTRSRNHVRLGLVRGSAGFRDVRIYRDLYHTAQGRSTVENVPGDSYFVLGDNTLQSKDSRAWTVTRLELADGTEVLYDAEDSAVTRIANVLRFPDIHGQKYEVRNFRTLRQQPPVKSPFVKREYIVGKAFSTFWPPFRHGRFNLHFVH